MQGAQDRWGLGSISFAPIVFPDGRPEIAEITSALVKERISRGYIGAASSRISKDMRNTLRDQHAKEVFDLRTLSTSISSSSSPSSSSPNPHLHRSPRDGSEPEIPQWRKHKEAIKNKLLGKAWNPQRKITRQAMEEVRYLRKQFPEEWTTQKLASHYNVSGEAIAKILRTKFQPHSERAAEQDAIREQARKQNIEASLERMKVERNAEYLKRKVERDAEYLRRKAEHQAAREAERERMRSQKLNERYGGMALTEFERLKAEKHAVWLERKAARNKTSKVAKIQGQQAGKQGEDEGEKGRTGATESRIKLGAPKRSIPTA
ncbi:Required for respiratory growth protein 9 mitochondrial [Haplosporangium sp. Z 767]|nr:Required for respiratory growth protein 9 mitochondrial [Haplosporangium sp. Z 11]KAF9178269.1 Required for respiratory growth protein 9 mitochondrial [Haplosporangium sp. Z 767]